VHYLLVAVVAGSAPAAKPAATTTSAPAATAVSGLKSPIFEQPALITSVGQSADAQMVKALADRSKLQYKFDTAAKPEALKATRLCSWLSAAAPKVWALPA
jgi:hypothetical protein